MNRRLRLRLKWLWLKSAYTFHWAHKPLCDRFAGDVVRVGGIHLCRSCLCVYAGLFSGVLLALLAPATIAAHPAIYLITLAAVLALSAPPLYKPLPRRVRDILRFVAGALLPLGLYLLITGSLAAGLIGVANLFVFWRIYFKVRKARKLRECDGCDELKKKSICSGFAMQAESMRRYERAATELVMNSGYVPECVNKM